MPRIYNKKRQQRYSKEDLAAAIEDIKSGRVSLNSAAKRHNIPKSTLSEHLNNKHTQAHGRPTRLTKEEESEIAQTCLIFSEWGYGLGKKEVLSVIHDYLKSKKKTHLFPNGIPGEAWWLGFLKRNPQLSLRKPQSLQIARAVSSTSDVVSHWFTDVLKPLLEKHNLHLHPNRIYNADETSFALCGRPTRVVTKRGAKSPQFVVGGTGRENITVQMCVSATGQLLPPYILYTGQRLMFDLTQGGPLGARYGVAPRGWMTELNFLDWFKNQFIPALPKERPVLLIMDGHKSHIKYEVRELAIQHSIEIAKLPAHTTHLLQPLDLSVIKPAKDAYDAAAHSFFRRNRRYITKRDFPSLLSEVWQAYKPESAINGFRKAGVHPLNPHVVQESSTNYSTPFQFLNPPDVADNPPVDQTQLSETTQSLQSPHDPSVHYTPSIDADTTYLCYNTSPDPSQTEDHDTTYPPQVDHHNSVSSHDDQCEFDQLQDISDLQSVDQHQGNAISITDLLGEDIMEVNDELPVSPTIQSHVSTNINSQPAEQTTTTTPPPKSKSPINSPESDHHLRHFFLSYLKQTPKLPNKRRNRQVTALGESLTAEEAMAKQKEAEEKKKKEQEEKETRKKERLEKKAKKKQEMEEKQRKKAEKKEKAKENMTVRKSNRVKKRKRIDDVDMCEICMEEWKEETEEEELWVQCDECTGWFHAKCVGYEPQVSEFSHYTCDLCK